VAETSGRQVTVEINHKLAYASLVRVQVNQNKFRLNQLYSLVTPATITFSAGEEFINTSIFVIYSGVSNGIPFFSLWILDNFISSTLVTWR
jgi:hypothetical protein